MAGLASARLQHSFHHAVKRPPFSNEQHGYVVAAHLPAGPCTLDAQRHIVPVAGSESRPMPPSAPTMSVLQRGGSFLQSRLSQLYSDTKQSYEKAVVTGAASVQSGYSDPDVESLR